MEKVVKVLLGCTLLGGIALGSGMIYQSYVSSQSEVLFHLKNYEISLEWGSKVPTDLEYYINTSELNSNYADTSSFKVSCDGKENELFGCLGVGSYNIILTCGDEKEVLPLEVKDTTKPEFSKEVSGITCVEGSDINYKSYFSAVDKVGDRDVPVSSLSITTKDVNLENPGEYTLSVSAEDSHGLSTSIDVPVKVLSVEEAYKQKYPVEDKDKLISKSPKYEKYVQDQEKSSKESLSQEGTKEDKSSSSDENGTTSTPSSEEIETLTSTESISTIETVYEYATVPVEAPDVSGGGVGSGTTISVTNMGEYQYPEYVDGSGLSDIAYSFASDVYWYILNSTNDVEELIAYNISDWDTLHSVELALQNTLGIPNRFVFTTESACDYDGVVWGDNSLNTCFKVTIQPNDIRADVSDNYGYQTAANAANIAAGLYTGMTDSEAVRAISNYICGIMSYSYDYATADTGFSSGWGNCSTYAEMFQLMCNDVGIPCNRVSGIASGANGWGSHAWNQVCIDGAWYYTDVCWMDTGGTDVYYLSPTLWNNHILQ